MVARFFYGRIHFCNKNLIGYYAVLRVPYEMRWSHDYFYGRINFWNKNLIDYYALLRVRDEMVARLFLWSYKFLEQKFNRLLGGITCTR